MCVCVCVCVCVCACECVCVSVCVCVCMHWDATEQYPQYAKPAITEKLGGGGGVKTLSEVMFFLQELHLFHD